MNKKCYFGSAFVSSLADLFLRPTIRCLTQGLSVISFVSPVVAANEQRPTNHAGDLTIDLAGRWRFQLDPHDLGEKESWFSTEIGQDEIDLPGTTDLAANEFRYLPRQDLFNTRIQDRELYASQDGMDWGKPLAGGRWSTHPRLRVIEFVPSVETRFFKLVALSANRVRPAVAIAELDNVLDSETPDRLDEKRPKIT